MDRHVVTVLPGGRITIPAAIRKELDLRPGDTLIWWRQDGAIHLRKAEPSVVADRDEQNSRPGATIADMLKKEAEDQA